VSEQVIQQVNEEEQEEAYNDASIVFLSLHPSP
jgi:hypothetical protein